MQSKNKFTPKLQIYRYSSDDTSPYEANRLNSSRIKTSSNKELMLQRSYSEILTKREKRMHRLLWRRSLSTVMYYSPTRRSSSMSHLVDDKMLYLNETKISSAVDKKKKAELLSPSSSDDDIQLKTEISHSMSQINDAVQTLHVFLDCKHFVDMPLKVNPKDIHYAWINFQEELKRNNRILDKEVLTNFVQEYYNEPGTDTIEYHDFNDFTTTPSILKVIKDNEFKKWAESLNQLWCKLGRSTVEDVKKNPHRYTIIGQEYPFIVPGGRFREFYYWDTYWIILGLLSCDMYDTARGIILNMVHMIEKYGFIPNGSRTYYLNRSQPPLLCEMVLAYYNTLNGNDNACQLVKECLPYLEIEYNYFTDIGTKAVQIRSLDDSEDLVLSRFFVETSQPRPESYREDMALAKNANLENVEADCLYCELAAVAESGWDFSSRFFGDGREMASTNITHLFPVDLNSILYKYELNMAFFYKEVENNKPKSVYYEYNAEVRKDAMDKLLWNEEDGIWYDFNFVQRKSNKREFASNYVPLWAGAFNKKQAKFAFEHFKKSNLRQPGGIVGTLKYSRQQWDFPNAWPPTQWLITEGLKNTNINEAKQLAREISVNWLYSNFAGYKLTNGGMFEKYDVRVWGYRGFGGEYEPQDGFGWTNGVCLSYLKEYGNDVNFKEFQLGMNVDDLEYKDNSFMKAIQIQLHVSKGDLRYIVYQIETNVKQGVVRTPSAFNVLGSLCVGTTEHCRAKPEHLSSHVLFHNSNLLFWHDIDDPKTTAQQQAQQRSSSSRNNNYNNNNTKVTSSHNMQRVLYLKLSKQRVKVPFTENEKSILGIEANDIIFDMLVEPKFWCELCRLYFKDLCEPKLLRYFDALKVEDSFNLDDLVIIWKDESENRDLIKKYLDERFGFQSMRQERLRMQIIVKSVITRCGIILAAPIATVLQNQGIIENCCVDMELELFNKLPMLGDIMATTLSELFELGANIRIHTVHDNDDTCDSLRHSAASLPII